MLGLARGFPPAAHPYQVPANGEVYPVQSDRRKPSSKDKEDQEDTAQDAIDRTKDPKAKSAGHEVDTRRTHNEDTIQKYKFGVKSMCRAMAVLGQ